MLRAAVPRSGSGRDSAAGRDQKRYSSYQHRDELRSRGLQLLAPTPPARLTTAVPLPMISREEGRRCPTGTDRGCAPAPAGACVNGAQVAGHPDERWGEGDERLVCGGILSDFPEWLGEHAERLAEARREGRPILLSLHVHSGYGTGLVTYSDDLTRAQAANYPWLIRRLEEA